MLKYLMEKKMYFTIKSTGIIKLNIFVCVSILYIMRHMIIDLAIIRSDIQHFSIHQSSL